VTSNNATLTVNPLPTRSSSIIKSYGRLVIPATGIYWGAEDPNLDKSPNFTGPDGIETELGRTMGVRRGSYGWTNGPKILPTQFEIDNANHTNPHIIVAVNQFAATQFPVKFAVPKASFPDGSWVSTDTTITAFGQGIDRVTNGEWDTQFTQTFNGLKALAAPVIYMIWKEFNGAEHNYFAEANGVHSETLWSPGTGEIAYRDAYRHVRSLANACGASISSGGNVIFVWAPQGSITHAGCWENYYPGDDYVDFIGIDLYRATVSTRMNSGVPGPDDHLLYKFSKGEMSGSSGVGRGGSAKPVMICEAGYTNGVDYNDSGIGGDGRNYRKDSDLPPPTPLNIQAKLLDDFQNFYPDVVIYTTWNVDAAPNMNRVDESPTSLSRYITFANDPYCGLFYEP
jgi:hypothetical protein